MLIRWMQPYVQNVCILFVRHSVCLFYKHGAGTPGHMSESLYDVCVLLIHGAVLHTVLRSAVAVPVWKFIKERVGVLVEQPPSEGFIPKHSQT